MYYQILVIFLLFSVGSLFSSPLTVVIPVRSANIEYLDSLLYSLAEQTVSPAATLVLLPPNHKNNYARLRKFFKHNSSLRGRVLYSPTDQCVAKIKNFSSKKITTAYVLYLEPEVTLHHQSLETVVNAFKDYNADLVLLRWTPSDCELKAEFYSENNLLPPIRVSHALETVTAVSDLKKWSQIKYGSFATRSSIVKRLKLPINWELIPNWQINDMNYIFNLIRKGKKGVVCPEPLLQVSRKILDDHY